MTEVLGNNGYNGYVAGNPLLNYKNVVMLIQMIKIIFNFSRKQVSEQIN